MRAPDLEGRGGKAWRILMPENPESAWVASIAQFVVNVPGAHPFWSFWGVTMIHLRDIPGVPPAHRRFLEATHEFGILAFNPEHGVPNVDNPDRYHYLTPPDVVEQFAGVNDDQAAKVCELAVRAIVDGRISPDQDYRPVWKEVIRQTVEYLALGTHAKGRA